MDSSNIKSLSMQANYSNTNDMFSETGSYPLENLSKENRWGKLAGALDLRHIEEEYNKRLSNQVRGACNNAAYFIAKKLKKFMMGLLCLLLGNRLRLQQFTITLILAAILGNHVKSEDNDE